MLYCVENRWMDFLRSTVRDYAPENGQDRSHGGESKLPEERLTSNFSMMLEQQNARNWVQKW